MGNDLDKIMQYVNTGEVNSGGANTILNSGAIGSCLVITAYDPVMNVGAMAHVMLPGSFRFKNQSQTTMYAADAIEEMLSQLNKIGTEIENIEICLVGGANVLKRENDSIGKDNLDSVEKLLSQKQIKIKARSVGGFERRTALFDIAKGCIYFTVGDQKQKILWQTGSKQK